MSEQSTQKRQLEGVVVSDKTTQTVIVTVERRTPHPLYGRVIKSTKRYHAHDETDQIVTGQRVRIEECQPLSRLKRWRVVEVLD